MVVIINDIYMCEDVEVLMCVQVLFIECICGVEIGGCLYIVICEDVSINLLVIVDLNVVILDLDLILIEFGGDNLVVIFLLELVDLMIYVIDIVVGQDILCKWGLGLVCLDLLVVNKIDLVLYVGVDIVLLESDVCVVCGMWFFVLVQMCYGKGVVEVVDFLVIEGGLELCVFV